MNKYSIIDMQQIAHKNKGQYLSKHYKTRCKLKWMCNKCNHIWKARPDSIIAGSWCPKCASQKRGDKQRSSMKEAQQIAATRGGRCLSKEYVTAKKPLQWECASGHSWEAPLSRIKSGCWCPRCRKHFTEEKCRYILEHLTNQKFNPTKINNSSYIFDGYNPTLKLAFEYHGEQHYKSIPHFQKTLTFHQRQEFDKAKISICQSRNIRLITIPFWIAKEGDQKLISFIRKELQINEIPVQLTKIDMSNLYVYASPLTELHQIAASRGGKCLSKEYIDSQKPMKWECSRKHIWHTRASHIKSGTWCKKCSKRKTIADMEKLATNKGGKCLSEEYNRYNTKMKWQCSQGHIWFATPSTIQQGRWCSICDSTHH